METERDTLPWRAGWLLSTPAGLQAPETQCRPGFRLGARPGEIVPNAKLVSWSIAFDPEPEAACLAHGVVLSDPASRRSHHVFCPLPGTLCGEAGHAVNVRLLSSRHEVRHEETQSLITAEGLCVALVIEKHGDGVRWALVWSDENEHETIVHANAALVTGARALWDGLVAGRRGIMDRARCGDEFRSAVVEAVELLLGALRPADGALPGLWLDTRGTAQAMDLGRSIAVLPAITMLSQADAEGLLRTILMLKEPDHSLPAAVAPNETIALPQAPAPMLAEALRALWRASSSLDKARDLVPRLVPVLQRQLDYFATTVDGPCCWRHAAESLTPDIHDADLATPDISALLLAEMEALAEVSAPFPDLAGTVAPVLARRERIERVVGDFFWDPEKSEFRSRYSDGRHISRSTVAGILPLLSSALAPDQVKALSMFVAEGGPLRTPEGIASWARWESDAFPPAISPLVQILVLRGLRRRGLDHVADALARDLTAHITAAWKTAGSLSAAFPAGTTSEPALETAALVVHLAFGDHLASQRVRRRVSPVLAWLDRHRHGLAAAAVLAALGTVVMAAWPSLVGVVDVSTLEPRAGMAQLLYDEGDYRGAIRVYQELLDSPLRDSRQLDYRLGNAWYRLDDFSRAEAAYRAAIARDPDQPRAWMNLASALFKQRRYDDAKKIYGDFIDTFGRLYPDLAGRAQTAIGLCDERTKAAP